ncbi:YhjD/YihY/BrkB family envelope integrity protein [Solwaraspora sp. WMMD406]|uniref:YhjD/YihY/BrkB family envelope integrity protein n=1 Tax=Solwaraspora sp. WMMD406 TaxID=3016095 RepID=UPI0024178830|nr:YhjD/YihY/BrkB family envelope integrity protein [Solwaraspora sp. WMMD406]MDG4764366.1 YhjD/YihY/BrkB family envelope integrity protein [Solwaraspora sp. WMMD406]
MAATRTEGSEPARDGSVADRPAGEGSTNDGSTNDRPQADARSTTDSAAGDSTAGDSATGDSTAGDSATGDSATGDRSVRLPVGPDEGPDSPTDLAASSWWAAVKRTAGEFTRDAIPDLAAGLTYYGVLSIFPGLLVLVAALGLLGDDTTDDVQGVIQELAPGEIGGFLDRAITQVRENSDTAGLVALFGLLVAFWSASGYIGAFMRASNAIYDVPEGRPIWKTLPIRLGVTAVIGLMLLASALIVVFTGDLARQAGDLLGIGPATVAAWNIAKWPVLVALVSLMFSTLYWASPNARHGGFRWITPGGILAVVLWLAVSAGFAFYVANFSSYNETYGAIAGVIVFLIWLWLTNIAILLGGELDAELERGRAIAAGHPDDREPYLRLRDDRTIPESRRPAAPERLVGAETDRVGS